MLYNNFFLRGNTMEPIWFVIIFFKHPLSFIMIIIIRLYLYNISTASNTKYIRFN